MTTAGGLSAAATTTTDLSSELSSPATAGGPLRDADNGAGGGGDMAAAAAARPSCRVGLRESISKMRWTASSLESLKSAEERLLVSVIFYVPKQHSYLSFTAGNFGKCVFVCRRSESGGPVTWTIRRLVRGQNNVPPHPPTTAVETSVFPYLVCISVRQTKV